MSQYTDYSKVGSFLSASSKRQALWNIVQPGDPYDIRKSMIAKVPGDKKSPMNEHLEIVCLFQAAQIERLCEFLDDFKLRHREIQRRELDRHSYEVQIKELTNKLNQDSNLREENDKLKDFIKNSSSSQKDLSDSYKNKYEDLLMQSKNFMEETSRLKRDNDNLQFQVSSFDAKVQALNRSKQTEIDDLYRKLSQQNNQSSSSQFQIQNIRSQYETEIQRINLQNKRLKQQLDDKSLDLSNWQDRYNKLERDHMKISPKADVTKYERKLAEYEDRFIMFGQEIERLNLKIQQLTVQNQDALNQNREYANKYHNIESEYNKLKISGGDRQRTFTDNSVNFNSKFNEQQLRKRISDLEYENNQIRQSLQNQQNQHFGGSNNNESEYRIRQLNDEVSRLKGQLRIEIDNMNRLKNDSQKQQYEQSRVRILEKQMSNLKQSAVENNSLKMRIAEDQNRIALLKQQIERLRELSQNQTGYDQKYRSLLADYQKLQIQVSDYQRKYQSMARNYQQQISIKVSEYESRIQNLNRTKGSQFENRAARLQNELQQMQEQLRKQTMDAQNSQRQLRELQLTITNKYQVQNSRKIQNYESNIQNIRRQNQELIRKIRQLEPLQRRIHEFENRSMITGQQMQRLSQQLRGKDIDIENLKRQIREQEISIAQKYQNDTSRKLSIYENNLNNASQQNIELKRRLSESQNKMALLSQQIERLINKERQAQMRINQMEQEIQRLNNLQRETQINITNKYEFEVNQKISHYENNIRNQQREAQDLRRRLQELQNSNRRLSEAQGQNTQLKNELRRLESMLQQKQEENQRILRDLQELNRKYNDLQNTVRNKYEIETKRVITTLEQNISGLKRQNDDQKRYIHEYEGKLKNQGGQMENLIINIRKISQDSENMKKQMMNTENKFRNIMEVEVNSKYKSYESNISQLRRQLENISRENGQLKRILKNAEQSNLMLNKENQELKRRFQSEFGQVSRKVNDYEHHISQLQKENQSLKRKINEMQITIREKYQIEANRRISQLEQNFSNASRQNEELKRQLQNANRDLEEFNRRHIDAQRKIEELNSRLMRETSEVNRKLSEYENQLRTKIPQYEQKIQSLSQQNNDLRRRLQDLDNMTRRISEYETKISMTTQELQKVVKYSDTKAAQMEDVIRRLERQNDDFRRKLNETQNTVTQKYEIEFERIKKALQASIDQLQRQNSQLKSYIQEFERKAGGQGHQVQSLNSRIQILTNENNQLRNQIRELQTNFSRKQYESSSKSNTFDRDELMKKLRKFEVTNAEYENQIAILKQQIQRLQYTLRHQAGQTTNYNGLQRENQDLKRALNELKRAHESESYRPGITGGTGASQHLQRQNDSLRRQVNDLQDNLRRVQRQNQDLQRRVNDMSGNLHNKLNSNEGDMQTMASQISKLSSGIKDYDQKLRELQQENDRLRRTNQQSEFTINQRLKSQYNSQITNYESTIRQLNQERDRSMSQNNTKTVSDLESKVALLSQQIERLNNTLRLKTQEVQNLTLNLNKAQSTNHSEFERMQSSYEKMIIQNDSYKKHIRNYEESIKKLYTEFERLQNIINEHKREKDGLFQKNFALSNEIERLLAENKDLQLQVQDVRLRLSDEAALHKRINEHMALMVVLFAQIQTLRLRVKQKQRQVEDVRRSSLAPFKLESRNQ